MAETEPFLAPRAAAWLGGALLAGMLGIVAFSLADFPRAASIETFSQTTAVGDTVYYTPPEPPLAVPEPVVTYQGSAWAPAPGEKFKIDDPHMRRLARDEASGLTLYERPGAQPSGPFIKIAVGEYLLLERR